ncbi:MAG TPA: signal peptidase I [Acidimicrobiales bacterium]|nr:signal peptidase I [Acidimicrobiales bacterium]
MATAFVRHPVSLEEAPARSGPQPLPGTAMLGRVARGAAAAVAWLAIGLSAVAFLGLAVGPRVMHYRTMTMLTGSMVPTIRPGNMVVDTSEPAQDLRIGQIVTYHIPVLDHHVESHRVVSIVRHANRTLTFRTKGDANDAVDPWSATVSDHDTMWRVRGVVPAVGAAIRALRHPAVGDLLRWGGLGAAALAMLAFIWGRGDEDTPGTAE